MFICLDCGIVFEEPKAYIERHGLDSPPYEVINGCPVCGGSYVETMCCNECGSWITDEYIELKDSSVICDKCYKVKNIEDNIY